MVKPKFCYNEQVLIVDGFYRGGRGVVVSHSLTLFGYRYGVYVDLTKIKFKEKELKSIDYPHDDFNNKVKKILK